MTSIERSAPFALLPSLTQAIWGGDALVRRYGKAGDSATRLGESWECWDENTIAEGALAGQRLADARLVLGADLMGPIDATARFPILTKIIDAREALSVQVHPDDAYAQRVEQQPVGKTECWYVLAAEPGAELVLGWTRDTDRAEFERRVAAGTLGDILRRVAVAAGDVFYLPAGTLHAVGAGIQLFETQQASDLTYRIFDWNRTGADGKPRELQVAKAADVLDFRATMPGAVTTIAFDDDGARRTLLIADRHFSVEHVALGARGAAIATAGRPIAVMAMDAPLRMSGAALGLDVAAWQTIVVPAGEPAVTLVPAGASGAALIVRPQSDLAGVRATAARAGIAAPALDAFFAQFR